MSKDLASHCRLDRFFIQIAGYQVNLAKKIPRLQNIPYGLLVLFIKVAYPDVLIFNEIYLVEPKCPKLDKFPFLEQFIIIQDMQFLVFIFR
jgi:hypothetical protein